ncbi:MAG TPA: HAMP domain-containing sensor histidine kinase [Blastocatellia bacterium]|nr:HAMP domain-containing sensor histidine kinase [Blastocatellia bacterium]
MTTRGRRPTLLLILLGALLMLLPLLAALQYRWLGQVSRAERERMQSSLRAGLAQLRRDFDRELARAFITFQPHPVTPLGQPAVAYAERYAHWARTAPYPGLVEALFVAGMAGNRPPSLARLNPESGRMETAAWPPELEGLRARLEQPPGPARIKMLMQDSFTRQPWRDKGRASERRESRAAALAGALVHYFVEPLADEVPALVVPLFEPPASNEDGPAQFSAPSGYAIVKLDLEFIRTEFLPTLIRRYFVIGEALDYRFTVVSRDDPGRVIYRSEASPSDSTAAEKDADVNLFGLRLDEFGRLLDEVAPRSGRPQEGGGRGADRFTLRVIRGAGNGASDGRTLFGEDGERWQLLAQHRSGSLEAAVGTARRRSLLISFGILLLLAVSVALIFVSARRAERLARQQMEFVAGVSHELRTPLAVICSAAENLADGYIGSPHQVRRYGAVIRGEGRRLTEMVEQVLEVAGAQSGRKAFELRPCDPSQVIESTLAACHPPLDEGGFAVEARLEPGLPHILADAAALSRAVQNLLGNAMKYSGDNRWIGLSAGAAPAERGPEVWIRVADRGPGIAPADLPHIFEPFYRGREVVAAQIRGNGLGLSLVKHIVEAHGGRVTVESAPGRGSAFTLHLPVAPTPASEVNYEQAHSAR